MNNIKKGKIALIAALAATAVCSGAFAITRLSFRSPLSYAEGNATENISVEKTNASATATGAPAPVAETPISTVNASTLAQINSAINTSVSQKGLVEIKLTGTTISVTATIEVPTNANVRIDLNGVNLQGTNSCGNVITVNGGYLEICDTSAAKTGTVNGCNDIGNVVYLNRGRFTLSGGTLISNYGAAVRTYQGSFIMNGGKVTATSCAAQGVVYVEQTGFYMYGGTITGCPSGQAEAAVAAVQGSDMRMYGGEVIQYTGGTGKPVTKKGVYVGSAGFYMYDGKISGFSSPTTGETFYGVDMVAGGVLLYGGTITGNGVGVNVQGGASGDFYMYGGEITKNSAYTGGGVIIGQGGGSKSNTIACYMYGGTISGNTSGGSCGGVYVTSSGGSNVTFTMNGGTITKNNCISGGGVDVGVGAKFIMNDGTITGNTADYGGAGLSVSGNSTYPSTATINGGTISGNTSYNYGGGILVQSGGTLNLNGGVISGNEVQRGSGVDNPGGGGLAIQGGTVNLKGGLITGNHVPSGKIVGGGVDYMSGGTFNVSGGVVANNYYTDANGNKTSDNDVAREGDSLKINITGKLNNAYIGVDYTTFNTSSTFTSGYTSSGNKIQENIPYFFSNRSGFSVDTYGNELSFNPDGPTRTALNWSYSVAGVSHSVSNPFNPTQVNYVGRNYSVSAGGEAFTIYNASGKIVKSISDAGIYTVFVKEAQLYTNPVFTLKVLPADLSSATVTSTDATYTGKAITPTVKVVLGGKTLAKDTDYTVSASNNINAGTGTVTITGAGNYYGSLSQTFTIDQAVIGLRWGNTELEYNGKEQSPVVMVEGLADGDDITVNVAYTKDGAVTSPVNAGTYTATATVTGNDNYTVRESSAVKDFTIAKKTINAIWSKTDFAYDETVNLTAYTYDARGRRVNLVVTVDSEAHTATAAFASNYADKDNYELANTTTSYTVGKSEATLEWTDVPESELVYDGTAKKPTATMKDSLGNIITEGLTVKYYTDGVEVENPTAAGTYTAKITFEHENYYYSGATDRVFTIKKAELAVTLDANFNGVYSGEGKTPVVSVSVPEGGAYVVLYAPVDNNGNELGEYTRLLPVDAGRYAYYVDISDELKHNYTVKANGDNYFEITAKSITASWVVNEGCHITGGKYTWLYDGKVHAPSVKFIDSDRNEVALSGDAVKVLGASSLLGDYTVRVELDSKNYVLSGTTTAECNIIKSRVTSVIWFSYGQEEALAEGEIPTYVNHSVYGSQGPKLTAYGVLTAANGNWNNSDGIVIQLKVSYDVSYPGYWPTRDNYVARATLNDSDQISDRCTLAGVDQSTLVQRFKVITLADESRAVEVKWVVIANGRHIPASEYNFVYNGEEQRPVPIVILSEDYDAANPVEGTYEILENVQGGATDAGTYYAYIVLDGKYVIAAEDAGVEFTISPMDIQVNWTVAEEYIYNGDVHAPEAEAVDTNYLPCTVTVTGYTDAGEWTAIADAGKNYNILNPEQTFVIKKATVEVEWEAGEGVWNDDGTAVIFNYDGDTAFAPTAKATFGDTELSLIVTGASQKTGTYYAYAVLDGSAYENLNFTLDENTVKIKFIVVRESVSIVWGIADEDGEIVETFEDGEEIVFTYDGTVKKLAAYYELDGVRHNLEVSGEGTAAGTYVAYVSEGVDAQNGKIRTFRIAPRALTVNWDVSAKEYTGAVLFPTVTFSYLDGEETVSVSLIKDVDYTVKGFTEAGTHGSEITFLNGNYTFEADSHSGSFTIAKKELTLTWRGNVNGKFEWAYDGNEHAPTVSPVNGVEIVVIGGGVNAGTYTAYAYTDNPNYVVANPEKEFTVNPFQITVTWSGNAEGKFEWAYDGEHYFAPTATYVDWSGEVQPLTVVGAKLYAGKHEATVVLPENCALKTVANGTQKFEITPKVVTSIKWLNGDGEEGDLVWEYDGKPHAPKAVIDDGSGEALIVTGAAINAGKGYEATAQLANENYVLKVENATVKFDITPKKNVQITWYGKDDAKESDFAWNYDGNLYAPRATFVDVNGKVVEIPVSGGATAAGVHTAEIVDVFDNYDFVTLQTWHDYTINHIDLTLTWAEGYTDTDGAYAYSFVYDGTNQAPVATANKDVSVAYEIVKDGKEVPAIIDAGIYTVTAISLDKNYKIVGVKSVTVEITKLTVKVEWANLSLEYNGKEQAPKAWYLDANGQKVELAVSGAQTAVGSSYAVSADFKTVTGNYELGEGKTNTFAITEQVKHVYVWVWNDDGTGKWKDLSDSTEEPEEPESDDYLYENGEAGVVLLTAGETESEGAAPVSVDNGGKDNSTVSGDVETTEPPKMQPHSDDDDGEPEEE